MENNNNTIVLVLSFIITIGVIYNDYHLKGSGKYPWLPWSLSHLGAISIMIALFSGFIKKAAYLNVVTLFFIIYMTSTLIQQWELNGLDQGGTCKYKDAWQTMQNISISTTSLDSTHTRYVYMLTYGISLILLMILCLTRFDQGNNLLFADPTLDFGLILSLPILLPFLTELPWSLANFAEDDNGFTPEYAFSHFIGGGPDISFRYIVGYCFILFLIIVLAANSTGGFNGSFTLFGSNNSVWPTGILLFILATFGFIMRFLFLQDCSIKEIKKQKDDNDNSIACNIGKYGGVTPLMMISLITLYVYNVKGLKDKMFAIILLGSFTFGFSELFTRLKNH
jgi:hypothetical protein